MKRMIGALMTMGALVILVAGLSAAQDLSGRWTMKVSGGPHGDTAMGLVVKQEGEKVTAAFDPGQNGEIPMSGTVVKGTLTLATPANDDGSRITMKATLKSDGTLAGFLSSVMGDMTWTATREEVQ